jgi:hypothetical protein
VAVVARVLLDHVGDDPAQRPGLARALRRLLADGIQARGLRDHLPRRGALPFKSIERLGRVGQVDVVEVGVLIGGPVVQIRHVLAEEHLPEPAALHLGHVPDQPQQGQGGRRDGAPPELLDSQVLALPDQNPPVMLQIALRRRRGRLTRVSLKGWKKQSALAGVVCRAFTLHGHRVSNITLLPL